VAIYEFFEKCIIPHAELNRVLFITDGGSDNSFAKNLDMALEKLKKQYAHRELNIEVLCIIREYMHFVNSLTRPETFEYQLRRQAKVWTDPKPTDNIFKHTRNDQYGINELKNGRKFHLLPNASYYIIVDVCSEPVEDPKGEKDSNGNPITLTCGTQNSLNSFYRV